MTSPAETSFRPLEGLTVLDFGQGVAGPYCSMLLGDFGARILKIEPMRGDWSRSMGSRVSDCESTTYLSVNRNKESLCFDFTKPEAREVALRLIGLADVVVESFRPGVMDRLGFGYADLSASHERLIYCSITGFGSDGPYAQLPAGDSTMQAVGGLMSIVGEPLGDPLRVGNVVSDMLAGMHGFEAVLLAHIERGATGRGRRVEVSLFDTLLAFQAPPLIEYLSTGRLPQRTGNSHPLVTPSGIVRTADRPVTFTVLGHQWDRFCGFLGKPGLETDERFATNERRTAHRDELMGIVQTHFEGQASCEVLDALRAADILCAPVNSYDDLARDPQVLARQAFRSVPSPRLGDVPFVANPIRTADAGKRPTPPPVLGEHTRMVLEQTLALSPEEIERLEALGAIPAQPERNVDRTGRSR